MASVRKQNLQETRLHVYLVKKRACIQIQDWLAARPGPTLKLLQLRPAGSASGTSTKADPWVRQGEGEGWCSVGLSWSLSSENMLPSPEPCQV